MHAASKGSAARIGSTTGQINCPISQRRRGCTVFCNNGNNSTTSFILFMALLMSADLASQPAFALPPRQSTGTDTAIIIMRPFTTETESSLPINVHSQTTSFLVHEIYSFPPSSRTGMTLQIPPMPISQTVAVSPVGHWQHQSLCQWHLHPDRALDHQSFAAAAVRSSLPRRLVVPVLSVERLIPPALPPMIALPPPTRLPKLTPGPDDHDQSTRRRIRHGTQCPLCGKQLSRRSGLKLHLMTHTNEHPYKCSFAGCSESFTQPCNRLRHERRRHHRAVSVQPQPESNCGVTTPPVPAPAASHDSCQ